MDLDNVVDANGKPAESRSAAFLARVVRLSQPGLSRRGEAGDPRTSRDPSIGRAGAQGKKQKERKRSPRAWRGTLLVINMYKVLISCRASERGRAGDRAIRRN